MKLKAVTAVLAALQLCFAADLKSGRHTLALRLTDQKNKGSRGTALRIVKFLAN